MLGVVLERGGDKIGPDCGPQLRHAEKINQIKKKTKDSKRDKTILDIFWCSEKKKKCEISNLAGCLFGSMGEDFFLVRGLFALGHHQNQPTRD